MSISVARRQLAALPLSVAAYIEQYYEDVDYE